MLQTWIHRIKPGKEARLREWFDELNSRSPEVRESFALAGVRAEQAIILSSVTGSLLVYVSEVADPANAARVFAESNGAIDVAHRERMVECCEEIAGVVPVYEASA